MLKSIPNPDLLFASFTEIRGTDRSDARELHIAYRYGEHYDSVRRINDDSEAPACLRMEVGFGGMSQLWVTDRADECCQLISILVWDGGKSWVSVSCWNSKALRSLQLMLPALLGGAVKDFSLWAGNESKADAVTWAVWEQSHLNDIIVHLKWKNKGKGGKSWKCNNWMQLSSPYLPF